MRTLQTSNESLVYARGVCLMFVMKTAVLGFAVLKRPYFVGKRHSNLRAYSVFLDVINIFQFIFMLSVIMKKSLFQFVLNIPMVVYSLVFTFMLIRDSKDIAYAYVNTGKWKDLEIALAFMYVYIGVLFLEAGFYIFMCIKLRKDAMWSNFKRVGADPVINEAFKRREEFNAVLRFTTMFLFAEFLYFSTHVRRHTVQHLCGMASLVFVLFVMSIFPNQEYVMQRRILLVFSTICLVGGVTYLIIDFVRLPKVRHPMAIWILENFFYIFNMIIILVTAIRDYNMFGSGLKEYYYFRGCSEEAEQEILLTG